MNLNNIPNWFPNRFKNFFCKRQYAKPTQFAALACLLLCGCESKGPPLEGKRQSFFEVSSGPKIMADQKLQSQMVSLPASTNITAWHNLGGNPAHSAVNAKISAQPRSAWSITVGDGAESSGTATKGVVADADTVYSVDAYGLVTAVSVKGSRPAKLWAKNISVDDELDDESLGGGICFDNGMLFVVAENSKLVCLDAKTGKVIWRKSTSQNIRSAPTAANGKVFVTNSNNETKVFDAKTGQKLWEHTGVEETIAILGGASPAVQGKIVVVGYSSGELVAINTESGRVMWSEALVPSSSSDNGMSLIPAIHASPVIDGNKVYVISNGGVMACFDLATGTKEWQNDVGGLQMPAVCGNWLFALSNNNEVIAVEKNTGGIRWVSKLPSYTGNESSKESVYWSGPIVADGKLVFSGSNGKLLFLNAKNGSIVNRLSFNGEVYKAPIVLNGALILLDSKAELHAWR